MKIKNISSRSFNCGGIWITPGETVTVSEDSNWMSWVERGKAEAIQVQIKEKGKEVIE